MIDVDSAIKTYLSSPDIRNTEGITCYYTAISEQWGLKAFDSQYHCQESHEFQGKAHTYNLAPAIGPDIFTFDENDCTYHAYLVEICPSIAKDVMKHLALKAKTLYEDNHIDAEEYGERCCHIGRQIEEQANILARELAGRVGFNFNDNHIGNWGYMLFDHIYSPTVCIDFGEAQH